MEQAQFANPKLRGILTVARPRSFGRFLCGVALEILAWSLVCVSFVIFWLVTVAMGAMMFGLIPLLVLFFLGSSVRRLAKAYRVDLRKTLMRDGRDPILYLRSFDADSTEFRGNIGGKIVERVISQIAAGHSIAAGFNDASITGEELIVAVLKEVGPVIAVGIPGEKIPPLGAARLYFEDKDWQANVEYLMSISRFVIIQVDISEGLEWEIATVKGILDPSRVFLSFLAWDIFDKETRQNLYELFKPKAESIFNGVWPDNIEKTVFMSFEPGWVPRPLEASRWKRIFYLKFQLSRGVFNFFKLNPSPATIRETIRVALKQRGVKLKVRYSLVRALINALIILYLVLSFSSSLWLGSEDGVLAILLTISSISIFLLLRKRARDKPPSISGSA
jgi:hypothetical protein